MGVNWANFKKVPSAGKLCRIHWTDVVAYINVEANEAVPAQVESVGYMHKDSKDFIVIASAYYQDEAAPDKKEGDFTALPKGMITKIEVL